jgi:hypothetical protein
MNGAPHLPRGTVVVLVEATMIVLAVLAIVALVVSISTIGLLGGVLFAVGAVTALLR